jgi:hypothetical protein
VMHETEPSDAPLTPAIGRVCVIDQLWLMEVPDRLVEPADAGRVQLVTTPKVSTVVVARRRHDRRRHGHCAAERSPSPLLVVGRHLCCIHQSCPRPPADARLSSSEALNGGAQVRRTGAP